MPQMTQNEDNEKVSETEKKSPDAAYTERRYRLYRELENAEDQIRAGKTRDAREALSDAHKRKGL